MALTRFRFPAVVWAVNGAIRRQIIEAEIVGWRAWKNA